MQGDRFARVRGRSPSVNVQLAPAVFMGEHWRCPQDLPLRRSLYANFGAALWGRIPQAMGESRIKSRRRRASAGGLRTVQPQRRRWH